MYLPVPRRNISITEFHQNEPNSQSHEIFILEFYDVEGEY